MARIGISIVFLSAVVVGGGVLAAAHLAPIWSVSVASPAPPATGSVSAAVTTSAGPQPSGRDIAAVPGGVPHAPRTPGHTLTRPRVTSPTPATPRSFTGLHVVFPRAWHSVTYEVRGPQKPPVRLVCPCPADNSTQTSADQSVQSGQAPANVATSDARVTLLEWNP
jgi:hypothetical protein